MYTIMYGGAIGEFINPVGAVPNSSSSNAEIWRFIYTFIFVFLNSIIIVIVILNVILATLIDTFSALREEQDLIQSDKKTACFICGIENSKFARFANGFEYHILNDHSAWDFLFLAEYIKQRDSSEYTSRETFVAECFMNRSIAFFPIG